MELSNANADPGSLLANLHAERESAAEEARRLAEQEEDDALVSQYFAKVPTIAAGDPKGKGKAKAVDVEADEDGEGAEVASDVEEEPGVPSLTIKRKAEPGGGGIAEPSVASLLAARGKALDNSGKPGGSGAANTTAIQQVKRKREGLQKSLGIKKKVKA
jgi:hypothetical protein